MEYESASDVRGPGYVYLLINWSMPGLVKVGRTARRPSERMAELSGVTGVPTPFELVFDIFVPDAAVAESMLHSLLSDSGYRVSDNREFFRAPVREAIKLMLYVRDYMPATSVSRERAPADLARSLEHLEAEARTRVADEVLEDRDELFRQAAELCVRHGAASTSLLTQKLRIGYGRSARIIDQLHRAGIVGPPDGSNPRRVLVSMEELDLKDE